MLDEKILIVDDQQINIMALKIILKLQGVEEMVQIKSILGLKEDESSEEEDIDGNKDSKSDQS